MTSGSARTTRAIILKRLKWSEADLIVHALESTGVHFHGLARGALKSKKRFGGGLLEPSHFLEMEVKDAHRADGLGVIEDARMLEDFSGLRTDYDRLQLALRFLDIVDRSGSGEAFAEIFNLLGNALKALASGGDLHRIEAQFSLKFLKLHGVLEFQSWMAPYLEKPIATPEGPGVYPELGAAKRGWLSEQLKEYLATAGIS